MLIKLFHQSQRVFSSAHLYLKEWVTNSSDLKTIIKQHHVACVDQTSVKVLGLRWYTSEDTLQLTELPCTQEKVTKRTVLSQTAKVFDPLGLTLPVLIKSRMFIQDLWRRQLDGTILYL